MKRITCADAVAATVVPYDGKIVCAALVVESIFTHSRKRKRSCPGAHMQQPVFPEKSPYISME